MTQSVIFVNRFYWPDVSSTSQLLTDLSEYLADCGQDIKIVTSRLKYEEQALVKEKYQNRNNVHIHRIWTTSFDRHSLIGQSINFLTFYLFASIKLCFLVHKNDSIVAKTDPPLIGILIWMIGRLKGAQVVNWCQDLFPEVARALGVRWMAGLSGFVLQGVRNHALQRSRMNVVVSNSMKEALAAQGVDRSRLKVIRNWPDRHIAPIEPGSNSLRKAWGLSSSFVLAYSGNLGRSHSAEQIYHLIDHLKAVPALRLLFIGAGHGMKWLEERCQAAAHGHVMFKPYQPKYQLSESLSVPDVHLVSLNERCLSYQFPSKFYGILAAGRPMVFIGSPNCEMARDIRAGRFGTILDPTRMTSWRDDILQLMENRPALEAMQIRARRAYETEFADSFSLGQWREVFMDDRQAEDTITGTVASMRSQSNRSGQLWPGTVEPIRPVGDTAETKLGPSRGT